MSESPGEVRHSKPVVVDQFTSVDMETPQQNECLNDLQPSVMSTSTETGRSASKSNHTGKFARGDDS